MAAYDEAWHHHSGELCFEADLPAFARLGRRFDELRVSVQDPVTSDDVTSLIREARRRIEGLHEAVVKPETSGLARLPVDPRTEEVLRTQVNEQLRAIRKNEPGLYSKLDAELEASAFLNGWSGTPPMLMAMRLHAALAHLPPDEYCRALGIADGSHGAVSHEASGVEAVSPEEPAEEDLPPGRYVIDCGPVEALTEEQQRTFDRLLDRQEEVIRDVRAALVDHYRSGLEMIEMDLHVKAGERPYLPAIVSGDELDDLIRVRSIHLHADGGSIGLVVEVAWDEDLLLGVRLEGDRIAEVGHDSIAYE